VGDIDISRLVAFHRDKGRLATLTAVRPPARFGALKVADDRVERFDEKPLSGSSWINGGFFVLNPGVLNDIDGDETIWEREPLERLAQRGELSAFMHKGFWRPMDTLRDKQYLEDCWYRGEAPWKIWD
jgi:glucose-1-phosphate cytidylyltransferase